MLFQFARYSRIAAFLESPELTKAYLQQHCQSHVIDTTRAPWSSNSSVGIVCIHPRPCHKASPRPYDKAGGPRPCCKAVRPCAGPGLRPRPAGPVATKATRPCLGPITRPQLCGLAGCKAARPCPGPSARPQLCGLAGCKAARPCVDPVTRPGVTVTVAPCSQSARCITRGLCHAGQCHAGACRRYTGMVCRTALCRVWQAFTASYADHATCNVHWCSPWAADHSLNVS